MPTQEAALDHPTLTEAFSYLDDLRESGATNMYGAGAYLAEEFLLDRRESSAVLAAWMKTFDGSSTAADRATVALARQEA